MSYYKQLEPFFKEDEDGYKEKVEKKTNGYNTLLEICSKTKPSQEEKELAIGLLNEFKYDYGSMTDLVLGQLKENKDDWHETFKYFQYIVEHKKEFDKTFMYYQQIEKSKMDSTEFTELMKVAYYLRHDVLEREKQIKYNQILDKFIAKQ